MAASTLLSSSIVGTGDANEDIPFEIERDHYLSVFRNIFERTNQLEHYNKMMGEHAGSPNRAGSSQ